MAYSEVRQVVIDNTQVSGSSNITDYPFEFIGTFADLKTTGNGGSIQNTSSTMGSSGSITGPTDLIFTSDAAGLTQLNHVIRDYDATTGYIHAVVKIPTISYNSDTTIYAHFGDATVSTSQENITGVWNSTYKGVWPLNETSAGSGAVTRYDETSNNNDLVDPSPYVASANDATLNLPVADFAIADETHLGITDASQTGLDITGSITIKTYIKRKSATASETIVSKYDSGGVNERGYQLAMYDNAGTPTAFIRGSSNGTSVVTHAVPQTFTTGQWYQFVGVIDVSNQEMKIFVNGSEIGTTATSTGLTSQYNNASDFRIGALGTTGIYASGWTDSYVSDVRVYAGVLSDDQIATEYANWNSPGTFFSFSNVPTVEAVTATMTSSGLAPTIDAETPTVIAPPVAEMTTSALVPGVTSTYNTDYTELFLDAENENSKSNLSYVVNKPTKNASNPLITPVPGALTWDHEKDRFTILTSPDWPIESRFRGWYLARPSDYSEIRMCYMISPTGEPGSWSFPNLGLVSVGGNTNNNVFQENFVINQVIYNPDAEAGKEYLFIVTADRTQPDGQRGCFKIYESGSPTNVGTLAKTIFELDPADLGTHIVQRDDGKWIGYFQIYDENDREIGYYISSTSDYTGTWTYGGVAVSAPNNQNQKYYMSSLKLSQNPDIFLGFIPRFDKTTELLPYIELYVSRDAVNYTPLDTEWIGLGSSPAWDDSIVQDTATLFRRGNTWTHPFTGGTKDHATSAREFSLGYADIGYRRIGGISPTTTTGSYTTDFYHPEGTNKKLKINGQFDGGSEKLEVELLDATGTAITGYTQADCDDITADTYNSYVTWGANKTLPNQPFQIVFHLTGADSELNSFETTPNVSIEAPTAEVSIEANVFSLVPDIAQLTLTGHAPTIDAQADITIAPPVATLTLTPQIVSIDTGPVSYSNTTHVFIGQNGSADGANTTMTYSLNSGSDSNRIALVGVTSETAASSVKYAGVEMTLINTVTQGILTSRLYGLLNNAVGINNVVITFPTTTSINSAAVTYSGVKSGDISNFQQTTSRGSGISSLTTSLAVSPERSLVVVYAKNYVDNVNATKNLTGRSTPIATWRMFDSNVGWGGSEADFTTSGTSSQQMTHNVISLPQLESSGVVMCF